MVVKNHAQMIKTHMQCYPNAKIEDLIKFISQSAWGCSHMVSSEEKAIEGIKKEAEDIKKYNSPLIEKLDGDFSRVSLACLNNGLSAKTLGKLFFLSADKGEKELSLIEKRLECALALAYKGHLPFSYDELKKHIDVYREKKYPSTHHSADFKNAYHPAYRVIYNGFIPYLPLFEEIDKALSQSTTVTIAIEGGSASGKTTLAALIEQLYDATVFHTDDYFLRPEQRLKDRLLEAGGNIDRERLFEQIILPLRKEKEIVYSPYNCHKQCLEPPVRVKLAPLRVVEGVYSMHPAFGKYYDFSAFLNIDAETQAKRIAKRNTPPLRERFFNEWIAKEQLYFSHFSIPALADIVIDINE